MADFVQPIKQIVAPLDRAASGLGRIGNFLQSEEIMGGRNPRDTADRCRMPLVTR